MKKYYFILFVIAVLVLLPNITEAQCSMCKAAVQSSMDQENSVARGINKGILYLMAVPYLLLAFIFRKHIISLWKTMRGKNVVGSAEDQSSIKIFPPPLTKISEPSANRTECGF